ncbi:MAG: LPS export ABC transporter periplasmic protein LptC [Alphaproteobacteria bacterium]|nr:LPS export ABC transporter periplasmic protein LptC [Alphaproteobacteria bacterium]
MKAAQPKARFVPAPPPVRVSRRVRRLGADHRSLFGADPYSRLVVLLKHLLPAIGAALLLLVVAWPRLAPLLESVRLGFSGIDLRAAGELKMLNPRYAGTDRFNRPYVITAAVGRQSPDHNDLMLLEKPQAVMIVHGGAAVVLTAATGIYQSPTQLLDLFDNVTLTHQNGTRFVTSRAHANVANETAEGHLPIAGHGPSGDIWGQGFRVLDRGDTIIFTGQSHAILRSTKPTKPQPAPPELPSHLLEMAAMIEAAASAPANLQPAPTAKSSGTQASGPAGSGARTSTSNNAPRGNLAAGL